MARRPEITLPEVTEAARRRREMAEVQARLDNQERRLEYLDTLDPRQRAVLSWGGE